VSHDRAGPRHHHGSMPTEWRSRTATTLLPRHLHLVGARKCVRVRSPALCPYLVPLRVCEPSWCETVQTWYRLCLPMKRSGSATYDELGFVSPDNAEYVAYQTILETVVAEHHCSLVPPLSQNPIARQSRNHSHKSLTARATGGLLRPFRSDLFTSRTA
jgi:hypothetical protein